MKGTVVRLMLFNRELTQILSVLSRSNVEDALHEDVECDVCRVSPIKGIRYRCITCADYDLCAVCENLTEHVHALIKLRRPDKADAERSQTHLNTTCIAIFHS
jgi:CRISPR/Cas system-associated protein Cas10 (large subunit of type III CRISPR-Cas system)